MNKFSDPCHIERIAGAHRIVVGSGLNLSEIDVTAVVNAYLLSVMVELTAKGSVFIPEIGRVVAVDWRDYTGQDLVERSSKANEYAKHDYMPEAVSLAIDGQDDSTAMNYLLVRNIKNRMKDREKFCTSELPPDRTTH